MKHYFLLVLSIFLLLSCGKIETMEESQWYGTLIRHIDDRELSEAALYFEGDKLHLYCNVFTGSKIEFSIYEDKDIKLGPDEFMYIWDDPDSNNYIILGIKRKGDELVVTDNINSEGDDLFGFHITCKKNKKKADEFKNKRFLNKDVVESVVRVFDGYLSGEIIRERDNTFLGNIAIIGNGDEIEVYCDYLFGKDNVKGKKINYNEIKDYQRGIFQNLTTFQMPNFKFDIDSDDSGRHWVQKNGYKISLEFQKEKPDLSFYQGKKAFTHADFYLVGNTYRGTMVIDPSKNVMNAFNSTMEHEMTMTFLDEETVRYTWEVQQNWDNVYMGIFTFLMGNKMNTDETHSYTISDTGSIHWSDCETDDEDFQIMDHGNRLEMNFEESGMSATLIKVN